MADFEVFPSEEALDVKCTREQLFQLAEHYSVAVADMCRKEINKMSLKLIRVKLGVMIADSDAPPLTWAASAPPFLARGQTFEQQRELLLL